MSHTRSVPSRDPVTQTGNRSSTARHRIVDVCPCSTITLCLLISKRTDHATSRERTYGLPTLHTRRSRSLPPLTTTVCRLPHPRTSPIASDPLILEKCWKGAPLESLSRSVLSRRGDRGRDVEALMILTAHTPAWCPSKDCNQVHVAVSKTCSEGVAMPTTRY